MDPKLNTQTGRSATNDPEAGLRAAGGAQRQAQLHLQQVLQQKVPQDCQVTILRRNALLKLSSICPHLQPSSLRTFTPGELSHILMPLMSIIQGLGIEHGRAGLAARALALTWIFFYITFSLSQIIQRLSSGYGNLKNKNFFVQDSCPGRSPAQGHRCRHDSLETSAQFDIHCLYGEFDSFLAVYRIERKLKCKKLSCLRSLK